jgi:peptidoglycan/xylan/chitin deacetylase (PgdA/CDA1 family)
MTIGVEEFEKQIRFLKKRYQIISASELNCWLNQGRKMKGKKAILITFDDGYEDNYINALPILKKYFCPAIFFIPTAYVGNDKQFEFERELQPKLKFKKMDWEQLKDAMQYNVEIGIHTDTHCLLSKVSYEEGVQEIEISKKKYMDNLGKDPVFMSYPFGGEKDITLKLVNYVENHPTITALFSAYGNKNISPIDRYNIKRVNIGSKDKVLLIFWYIAEGGLRTLLYPYESW